ncbi:SMEK domain-containing protein [Desulfosporosinus fructosivorans]
MVINNELKESKNVESNVYIVLDMMGMVDVTRREEYLSTIHRMLSLAEIELESQGKKGLHNGNIVWEDIANRILNICFSYNTINLNQEKANFPGIDLGNRKNGIGIQVTRRNDTTKVKDTIETVLQNQVYKTFPNLKFFVLVRKKGKYALDCKSWEQCLQFDAMSLMWLKQCSSIC